MSAVFGPSLIRQIVLRWDEAIRRQAGKSQNLERCRAALQISGPVRSRLAERETRRNR
jgi:hypothetical protein